MTHPTLRAALALARRGVPVFRVSPGAKVPIKGTRGCSDATTCPTTLTAWWREAPNCNLAAASGHKHWLLDIDPIHDGETTLARLEAAHGGLPATVEIITPSGGRHLWWQWNPLRPVANSAGRLGPGLDTRGIGGYGLVPPSQVDGKPYRWSVDCADAISAPPEWLMALVALPPPGTAATGRGASAPGEWAALAGQPIPEGHRNQTLAKVAGLLFRRGVEPHLVADLIHGLNLLRCAPALPNEEVDAILESIAKRELKRLRESARAA